MALRRLVCVGIAATVFASMGCYSAPIMPPTGVVYTETRAPAMGLKKATRRGEASSVSILGLFAWGDASQEAAARNGDLRSVSHLDYEFRNVLGIYQRFTTIAYGE